MLFLSSLQAVFSEIWLVTLAMAPYLLLGFLIAGLLSVFLKPQWIKNHLGSSEFGAVFTASFFGVPLPLCSCGVIPVVTSLRKQGASRGAATSFLLSTPQTGVDSVLVTYALLGPVFAIIRPIIAFVSGIVGGILVNKLDRRKEIEGFAALETEISAPKLPFSKRLLSGLNFGLVTLPGDISREIIIGIVAAGIISALIPANYFSAFLGNSFLSIIVLMLIGIPLYVCSTGSVALAFSFMHLGFSPGALLAFLITGPATNAATIVTIIKILGKKSTVIYLATVGFSALVSGLLLNCFYPDFVIVADKMNGHIGGQSALGSAISYISAVVLLILLAMPKLRKTFAFFCHPNTVLVQGVGKEDLEIMEIAVSGMTCQNCVKHLKEKLESMSEIIFAEVTLEPGGALLRGEKIDFLAVQTVINNLGYTCTLRERDKS